MQVHATLDHVYLEGRVQLLDKAIYVVVNGQVGAPFPSFHQIHPSWGQQLYFVAKDLSL